MQVHTTAATRPEAMGDVPGICELPLTRAVVQYRSVHEMDTTGGRIEDIGLALVVEGRYASTSEVVDLGSGSVKVLDLSTELLNLSTPFALPEPTLQQRPQVTRPLLGGSKMPVLFRGHDKPHNHGMIRIGVPSGTAAQISAISELLTAMHPSVQSNGASAQENKPSPFGEPWIIIEPPGDTFRAAAFASSAEFGYEM